MSAETHPPVGKGVGDEDAGAAGKGVDAAPPAAPHAEDEGELPAFHQVWWPPRPHSEATLRLAHARKPARQAQQALAQLPLHAAPACLMIGGIPCVPLYPRGASTRALPHAQLLGGADRLDYLLMFVGTVGAVGNGVCWCVPGTYSSTHCASHNVVALLWRCRALCGLG